MLTIGEGYDLFEELREVNPNEALGRYIEQNDDTPEIDQIVETHRALFDECANGYEAYQKLVGKYLKRTDPCGVLNTIEQLEYAIRTERPSAAMFAERLVNFIRMYEVPASFFLALSQLFQVLGLTKRRRVHIAGKVVRTPRTQERWGVAPTMEKLLVERAMGERELEELFLSEERKFKPGAVGRALVKLAKDRRYLVDESDGKYKLTRTTQWYIDAGEDVPDGTPLPREKKKPGRRKKSTIEESITGGID